MSRATPCYVGVVRSLQHVRIELTMIETQELVDLLQNALAYPYSSDCRFRNFTWLTPPPRSFPVFEYQALAAQWICLSMEYGPNATPSHERRRVAKSPIVSCKGFSCSSAYQSSAYSHILPSVHCLFFHSIQNDGRFYSRG